MLTADPVRITVAGRPMWRFPDGTLLPVIHGGADDDTPPPPVEEPSTEPVDEPDKPLGPQGEKALDEWKRRARAAEADAKRTKELEAEVAELRAAQMSDQEKALEQARKEADETARAEERSKTSGRLFRSELRAAAASKLSEAATADLLVDTDVALKLLGLDEIPVTDTGDVNSEAISHAVTSYLEARPYLAASATLEPGAIDQGARPTGSVVESLDDRIAKAEQAGDWKLSGRLKTEKLLAR